MTTLHTVCVHGIYIALLPAPCPSLAVRISGEPGTFPHVSDVNGRKTVERPKLNVGLRAARSR